MLACVHAATNAVAACVSGCMPSFDSPASSCMASFTLRCPPSALMRRVTSCRASLMRSSSVYGRERTRTSLPSNTQVSNAVFLKGSVMHQATPIALGRMKVAQSLPEL